MVKTSGQKLFRKASEIITKLPGNKKRAGSIRSFEKKDNGFCFIFEIPKTLRPDHYPIEGIFSIFLTRKSKEENYTGLKYEFSIKQLDTSGKVLKNIGSNGVAIWTLDDFWNKLCGLQKLLRPN